MFSHAYEIASGYTKPVITSVRFDDESVESSLGSFVILNDEGWILTAGHILNSFMVYQNHKKGKGFEKQQRIVNHSFWWGADKLRIEKSHVNFEIDLALAKLVDLPDGFVKEFPKIIHPGKIKPGTSLCKLGYPFYNIKSTWNSQKKGFEVDPKLFPIPRFPLEGMYTRNAILGKSRDNKYQKKYIETSSPGLKGQSGGPIFDVHGVLWAIQSQTVSLPLGFSPKHKKGTAETVEHQFINVGLGVHAEIIIQFLNEHGIKFDVAS